MAAAGVKKEDVLVFQGEESFILPNQIARKSQKQEQNYKRITGDNINGDGSMDLPPVHDGGGIPDVPPDEPPLLPPYNYPNWDSLDCAQLQTEVNRLQGYIDIKRGLTPEALAPLNANLALGHSLMSSKNCNTVSLPPSGGAVPIEPSPIEEPPPPVRLDLNEKPLTCVATVNEINVSVNQGTVSVQVDMSADGIGFNYSISVAGSVAEYSSGNVEGKSTTINNVAAGDYTIKVIPKCAEGSGEAKTRTFTVPVYGNTSTLPATPTIPILPVAAVPLGSSLKSGGGGGGGGSSSTAAKTTASKKTNWWLWLLIAAAAAGVYYTTKEK